MKKTLVVMMAFVLGLAITSCKQGPKVVDAAEAAADPAKTLTELVDKAKAEGANWSVDEWKDAFKTAMACVAPTMKEVQELTSSLQTKEGEEPDTAKLAEVMTKLGELKVKYDGYIRRQDRQVYRFAKLEGIRIPEDFDYDKVEGISTESREKLKAVRPTSIGQASRINGVRTSDVTVLLVYLRK